MRSCWLWNKLMQQFHMFWSENNAKAAQTSEVTGRHRLQLSTRPSLTGSAPVTKTIGIVLVAAFAANADGTSKAQITATLRFTNSAARDGRRS